jgi:hypothetical protein
MPMYFFNTVDGRRYPDEDGSDLPDFAAVRAKATRVIGELLKEQPEDLWHTGKLCVEVTDDAGAKVLLLQVTLSAPAAQT